MIDTKRYNRINEKYKRLSQFVEKIIFKPNTIAKRFNLPSNIIYLWGKKKSTIFRELAAKLLSKKTIFLEDGFIRSINYGSKEEAFSICIDKKNIYYDYSCSNDLDEYIIKNIDKKKFDRAQKIRKLWTRSRISKYNCELESEAPQEPFILLVDQTLGDKSINYGGASKESFKIMLNFAIKYWPKHTLLIKTHPDVIHGKKSGHFSYNELNKERVKICDDGGHPTKLLEKSDAVCVVTSQLGFEALIWNKPVYVFGWPFYAGWGLTRDYLGIHKRRSCHKINIEQLINAVLVDYCLYINPETLKICRPEDLIKWIKFQRDQIKKLPNNSVAIGFTPWKANQLRRFIPNVRFINGVNKKNTKEKKLLIWGKRKNKILQFSNNSIIRVEDGFIRSVGLGANLIEASSLIFDKRGIYYDSSKYSDLEDILNHSNLSIKDEIRTQKLLEEIIKLELTKYNLNGKEWTKPENSKGKEIILVLGQVENDASIRLGIPKESNIRSNYELVKITRRQYPNAWIIYKPHPDVCSKLRSAGKNESRVKDFSDEITRDINIENLYKKIDRLSVLTSLGGFEGLIRGIPVTTWGIPFYAGWGLTDDKLKNHPWITSKRIKKLNLLELIHGCLIAYPMYSSNKTRKLCTPEEALKEIHYLKQQGNFNLNKTQAIFRYWGAIIDQLKVR